MTFFSSFVSGNNKKNMSKCRLLNFSDHAKRENAHSENVLLRVIPHSILFFNQVSDN